MVSKHTVKTTLKNKKMNLEHYSLNEPHQGLNGWRNWLRKAIKTIANIVAPVIGGAIVDAVFNEIQENSSNDWSEASISDLWNKGLVISQGSNIPEDWNPTFDEEQILDKFVNTDAKDFFAYVNQIFANIKNKTNYSEQLVEYNNLIKSYELFKSYHKTHKIVGLSDYGKLAKIEVIDVFMREIAKQLDAIFNTDANTNEQDKTDNLSAGSSLTIGTYTVPVKVAFSTVYKQYQLKTSNITTTNPTTGVTTTSNANTGGAVTLPTEGTKDLPQNKTYLWGYFDLKNKPVSSTLIAVAIAYGGYKIVKKVFK